MKITTITPAFNCAATIGQVLQRLTEMRLREEIHEIIVVDDGSTDGTAAVAAEFGAKVISSGGRCGPGAARNIGAQYAQGTVLWFIDSDVVPHDDAALRVHEAFLSNDVIAVFGSYDERPVARNFFSQYKNLVHHHYHQRGARQASTFWAGCGAVRKAEFVAAGGFDALTYKRPSVEDIEFGYRLRATGAKILLVPELQGTHLKSWRFWSLLRTEVRDRAIPWARLLMKRAGPSDELNVSKAERIRAALAASLVLSVVPAAAGLVAWWLPLPFLVAAFAVNFKLFTLFARRNGVWFAVRGLGFHQLYYCYSSAAFCGCWIEANIEKLGSGRKLCRRMYGDRPRHPDLRRS